MKTSRFTEEQIAFALRHAEAGTPAEEICRKLGASEQAFCRWKTTFAGAGAYQGPVGIIDMGGVFTVVKVSKGITSYEDPGWYQHPARTVAHAVTMSGPSQTQPATKPEHKH